MLALEDAERIKIKVSDVNVPFSIEEQSGWQADEDIKTVKVPAHVIRKGTNTVALSYAFGVLTNIERIYLLGKFGVKLDGNFTSMYPVDLKDITWGNIVP